MANLHASTGSAPRAAITFMMEETRRSGGRHRCLRHWNRRGSKVRLVGEARQVGANLAVARRHSKAWISKLHVLLVLFSNIWGTVSFETFIHYLATCLGVPGRASTLTFSSTMHIAVLIHASESRFAKITDCVVHTAVERLTLFVNLPIEARDWSGVGVTHIPSPDCILWISCRECSLRRRRRRRRRRWR